MIYSRHDAVNVRRQNCPITTNPNINNMNQTGILGHITKYKPTGKSFESQYGKFHIFEVEFASGFKGVCNSKDQNGKYKAGDSVFYSSTVDPKSGDNKVKILGTEAYQAKAANRSNDFASSPSAAPASASSYNPNGAELGNARNIAAVFVTHNAKIHASIITPEEIRSGSFQDFVNAILGK
jgi:hypothetical protein